MKFLRYIDVSNALREQAFKLYVSSFPDYERRSEACHTLALNDSEYSAQVVVDDNDQLLALLFSWKYHQMVYVEHIAVNPEMRGQNIGSTVLSKFIEDNSGLTVVLEIDPPIDDVAIRRLRFYSHLGFIDNDFDYAHPSYSVGGHPHKLVILSHGRTISRIEFDRFVDYLHDRVLKYID